MKCGVLRPGGRSSKPVQVSREARGNTSNRPASVLMLPPRRKKLRAEVPIRVNMHLSSSLHVRCSAFLPFEQRNG